MLIDATNITELGLKLLNVKGLFDLPPRKKVLDNPSHTAANLKFEEFDVTLKMFGRYASETAAAAAVAQLKGLLAFQVTHVFNIVSRGVSFNGIVKSGFSVETFKNIIIINLKVTVTECLTGNLMV